MGTRPVRADDELVTAAKRGDAAAWRELYRAHAGRLLLWLEARASPGGEAPDDIAAAAWLVAAERIADFHGSGSDFGGWLFGIARKHAANASRRTATRIKGFETLAADAEPTMAGPEGGILAEEWVHDALAALPPRERDVIACTEVLDLDVSATAAALGMTAVAVRVARHRGLKRLRTHLGPG
ncbi:sigma-70 family RNA polymerase sigma factor [Nocardioides albidus]|uniref:Sigma-70 family RNA polymerase sigma factor n=1 Tax=Nocardioides albidus TaxID=1517589 RepID=A0A5C4VPV9_9ACTN|nr:sigma-70 family RNA polymerase sigma factor [Nocardioides albidus]TNM37525.1 sigma-70 family RNA polymerase sigma factor [Nocardioides albidus]